MKKILLLIATFFNIGRIRVAPGTFTSLAVILIVYFGYSLYPLPWIYFSAIIVAVFVLGIPAASVAEKHYQKKDPRQCVIDEVAGQMVGLILLPHSWWFYFASFVLFRFFDILKPFPIKNAEKIPGGVGIMLDDVVAGLFTLGILHLWIYITGTLL